MRLACPDGLCLIAAVFRVSERVGHVAFAPGREQEMSICGATISAQRAFASAPHQLRLDGQLPQVGPNIFDLLGQARNLGSQLGYLAPQLLDLRMVLHRRRGDRRWTFRNRHGWRTWH